MAQVSFFTPINALELVVGQQYTTSNIPATADTVVLEMGERLTDNKGEPTPIRGVRMQIIDNEALPANPVPKVPYIWHEGTELRFNPAYIYVPLNWGIVSYGMKVV